MVTNGLSAEILSSTPEIDSSPSESIHSPLSKIREHILQTLRAQDQRQRNSDVYKELKIQLTPPHLGRLTVRVSQDDHGVSVRVQASTVEAQRLLVSELSLLEGDLRQQGIRLASLEVSVGAEGSFQQFQRQQQTLHRTRSPRWAMPERLEAVEPQMGPRMTYAAGHLNLMV